MVRSAGALLATCGVALWGCSAGTPITASDRSAVALPRAVTVSADGRTREGQVLAVSARAQRCGLAFDEAKLKASYLRYEAVQGAAGAQLATIEKSYDAARAEILRSASSEPLVCSAKE